jgi:hypothetical protein
MAGLTQIVQQLEAAPDLRCVTSRQLARRADVLTEAYAGQWSKYSTRFLDIRRGTRGACTGTLAYTSSNKGELPALRLVTELG